MIILDVIAGILISTLAGLGIGGGGLLVIYLVFFKDMEQLSAQGINLLFFILAAAASLFIHFRKYKLNKKVLLLTVSGGTVGALLGCFIAEKISVNWIKIIFGVLLILTGVRELFTKEKEYENDNDKHKK